MPHEVAILEKLLMGWPQKRVARYYHYEHVSSVSRVKTKYEHLLVNIEVCAGAKPTIGDR